MLVVNLTEKVFLLKCLIMSASLKLHSIMFPPNCLKRFYIDASVDYCFLFAVYVLPNLFLVTI